MASFGWADPARQAVAGVFRTVALPGIAPATLPETGTSRKRAE